MLEGQEKIAFQGHSQVIGNLPSTLVQLIFEFVEDGLDFDSGIFESIQKCIVVWLLEFVNIL